MDRKFTMTITQEGESLNIECENRGFSAFEILGFLKHKENDILEQLNQPCNFKRTVVDENGVRYKKVKEGEE